MKSLILSVVSLIISSQVHAASIAEAQDVSSRLSQEFAQDIAQAGYQGVEFFEDLQSVDYPGGVNLVDGKIRIIIGTHMLTQFSTGALAFISCHELGHILGGEPYKLNKSKSLKDVHLSMEGQSDYWAGGQCLSKISATPIQDALDFFTTMSRSLNDIVGDNPFYQPPVLGGVDDYYYDGEYPSFQCRFNTVIAGFKGEPRPGCWYKK